jgi:branched-chain amino acid transport system ATP-binding protein
MVSPRVDAARIVDSSPPRMFLFEPRLDIKNYRSPTNGEAGRTGLATVSFRILAANARGSQAARIADPDRQDAVTAPLLEVERLVVGYGSAAVLHGVDLTIDEGSLVALVGGNGAGKSTLLRAISGLVPPRSGAIRFRGQNIAGLPPERIARLGLLHVPEGRHVFADQTTEDNLFLGAYRRMQHEGRAAIRRDVEATFERFPQLAERRHSLAGLLSGGEQQILAIARALIGKPDLLMLDEPSLGLAPRITSLIFSLLDDERRKGVTILLVEQLAYAALGIADRGYVLSRGAIALSGASRDLLADPEIRKAYLGAGQHGA